MTDDYESEIDYPAMIDDAMRSVVKKSLIFAHKNNGMPGEHHFFISFDTTHAGVQVSPQIKQRFPEEMTIVLQHQYWDLNIQEHLFSVMLSFNNIPEKLVIPYSALTAFADPSVKFGLQFHNKPLDSEELNAIEQQILAEIEGDASFDSLMPSTGDNEDDKDGNATAEVISLDSFRKK